ncbi:MAG TPA: cupin domain-containing protein [Bacteroidota bacterium]|nr:cupin domain-containing protein [Bacteroidota bacterium]
MSPRRLLSFLFLSAMVTIAPSISAQSANRKPEPRVVQLDLSATDSMDILTGPPGTVTMHSGYMVLAPGKSVGRHSTRGYEEALIVLAGSGEMRIINSRTMQLKPYSVAYCPPATEHDVFNTGNDTLRYVYLVAKAKN